MIECPNCNNFFNDDFAFCPYCGQKKPKPLTCPKCGYEDGSNEYSFCPYCGIKLTSENSLDKNIKKMDEEVLMNHIDRYYNFFIINFGFSIFNIIREKIFNSEITSVDEIYREAILIKKDKEKQYNEEDEYKEDEYEEDEYEEDEYEYEEEYEVERSIEEIADDYCYENEFDDWEDYKKGVLFKLYPTGFYAGKTEYLTDSELEEWERNRRRRL